MTKNGNWIISNDKGSTNYGYIIKKYKFKFKNENNVTYLLITMPIYTLSAKVLCIKS